MEDLTSVFGMGTGIAPPALPPETLISEKIITFTIQLLQAVFDNRRKKK
jgi:hypothetical protein